MPFRPHEGNPKRTIVPSSEYLLTEHETIGDYKSESSIPHSVDPFKDMSKKYWFNENDQLAVNTCSAEENKIYLNEENNYYATTGEEYVNIIELDGDSIVTLMAASSGI